MKSQNLACGIDVSKDTLDLYYNDSDGREHYLKVSNDQKGHDLLIGKLGLKRTYIMESSGPLLLTARFQTQNLGRRRTHRESYSSKAFHTNAPGAE